MENYFDKNTFKDSKKFNSIVLKKLAYYLFLFLSILVLLEGLLRISGVFSVPRMKDPTQFYIQYGAAFLHEPRFMHPANAIISEVTREFSFTCKSNEFGYRDLPISTSIDSKMNRILFVGDSFIEGVGSDCNASMPHNFKYVNDDDNLQVINAGKGGSDVLYALELLEYDMPSIKPGVVMLGVNGSDIYDYLIRGGTERFRGDDHIVYRDSPVNLDLYRKSHLFRAYVHIILCRKKFTLLTKTQEVIHRARAIEEITYHINQMDSLVTAHDARFIVFFYPTPANLSSRLELKEIQELYVNCTKNELNCILLSKAFQELASNKSVPFKELYWEQDGHFNNEGYRHFAIILKKALDESNFLWK